jgi:hypothetical protein
MKADTPIVLAAATYANRDGAVADFHAVMDAKGEGEYDHIAVAVMTKDADGHVQVERHDSTAKHLAWGGALVSAGLLVTAPVSAPVIIAAGGVTTVGTAAGVGGLAGHFWHNIPKEKTREMGDLLESGDSGLLIVAVNKKGSDIGPLLANATETVIDDTTKADLEGVYDDAIAAATA